MQRKAKTQKGKRLLKARAPKLVENVKSCLFLKGPTCSGMVTELLKDLKKLKGPASKMFSRKNMTRPFEDASSMEFFSQSNDTSLFVYGSHSKKRPHNLVFGRLFNHQMLDMMELDVNVKTVKTMRQCEQKRSAIVRPGSKPLFLFLGEDFELKPDFVLFKEYVLDFFRGDIVQEINLAGLDRVIVCATANERVYFKHCAIRLKRSGTRYPKVELQEAGPCFDVGIRRVRNADPNVMSAAMIKPKTHKKRKNIEQGFLGAKVGRVHMKKQKTDEINITSMNKVKSSRS